MPLIGELAGIPDDFEKDRDQMDREARWAAARIVRVGRIRHVRCVVGGIEVLSIPARREEDLSSQTIGAIVVREVSSLWLGSPTIVETVVADCLRRKVGTTSTFEWVAGNHAKAWRGGFNLFSISSTLQIVDSHTTNLIDAFESSVLMLEEKIRSPVIAVVSDYCTRGASRSLCRVVVHGEIESVSSHDSVQVVGHLAGADDGVGALHDDWRFAG